MADCLALNADQAGMVQKAQGIPGHLWPALLAAYMASVNEECNGDALPLQDWPGVVEEPLVVVGKSEDDTFFRQRLLPGQALPQVIQGQKMCPPVSQCGELLSQFCRSAVEPQAF